MSSADLSVTKHCSKCRAILPATLEFFAKLPTMKLGFASRCRACANAHQKAKRAAASKPKPTTAERFWAKVKIGAPSECWEWSGGRQPAGYGVFWLAGKSVGAHVMSWSIANAAAPGALFVCHRCDNPPCVNPDHLFLGDASDNALDMVGKGRGGGQYIARLRDSDLDKIKELRKAGFRYKAIAQQFSVSWETVRDVAKGRKGRG